MPSAPFPGRPNLYHGATAQREVTTLLELYNRVPGQKKNNRHVPAAYEATSLKQQVGNLSNTTHMLPTIPGSTSNSFTSVSLTQQSGSHQVEMPGLTLSSSATTMDGSAATEVTEASTDVQLLEYTKERAVTWEDLKNRPPIYPGVDGEDWQFSSAEEIIRETTTMDVPYELQRIIFETAAKLDSQTVVTGPAGFWSKPSKLQVTAPPFVACELCKVQSVKISGPQNTLTLIAISPCSSSNTTHILDTAPQLKCLAFLFPKSTSVSVINQFVQKVKLFRDPRIVVLSQYGHPREWDSKDRVQPSKFWSVVETLSRDRFICDDGERWDEEVIKNFRALRPEVSLLGD